MKRRPTAVAHPWRRVHRGTEKGGGGEGTQPLPTHQEVKTFGRWRGSERILFLKKIGELARTGSQRLPQPF